jgi:hypothetical protein
LEKVSDLVGQKIKIDNTETLYDLENFNELERQTLDGLQFSIRRINELKHMQKLLQQAKKSYVDSLKREMLSGKAGYLFEDE